MPEEENKFDSYKYTSPNPPTVPDSRNPHLEKDDRPPFYMWVNDSPSTGPRVEIGPTPDGKPMLITSPDPRLFLNPDQKSREHDRRSGGDAITEGKVEARALIESMGPKGYRPVEVPCPEAAREVARAQNVQRENLEARLGNDAPGYGPAHDLAMGPPTVDLQQFSHLPPPPAAPEVEPRPDLPPPPFDNDDLHVGIAEYGKAAWDMAKVQRDLEAELPRLEITDPNAFFALQGELTDALSEAADVDSELDLRLQEELRAALEAGAVPEFTKEELEVQLERYQNEVANVELEKEMGIDPDDDGPAPEYVPEPDPAPKAGPGGAAKDLSAEPSPGPNDTWTNPHGNEVPYLEFQPGASPTKGPEAAPDTGPNKDRIVPVELTPGGATVAMTPSEAANVHALRLKNMEGYKPPEKSKEPSMEEKKAAWEKGPKTTPHPAVELAIKATPHGIEASVNAEPRMRLGGGRKLSKSKKLQARPEGLRPPAPWNRS